LTVIDFAVALLPKLSAALTVIVSEVVVGSLSASVVRSASTCANVPAIVSVLPPFDGVIVPPPPVALVFADSVPFVSASVTVKLSPLVVVLPLSETLTPVIGDAVFCCTVCGLVTAIDGNPFTVSDIADGPALPPLLSLAFTVIVSEAVVGSWSVRVVRSALTWANVPTIVSVLPPFDGVIVPPPPVAPVFADSVPFVSLTIAVKFSPPVVGDSEMLTPEIRLV